MSSNTFFIQIRISYIIVGIITATLIGSVACIVWLFLNRGTAKFYVKDAMRFLKLIMACFIVPIVPFLIYPFFMNIYGYHMFPMSKNMVKGAMVCLAIWVVSVVLVLLKRVVNYLKLCKLCRDNIPVEEEAIVMEVERWKRHLGIRRKVGIYINAHLSSPAILYYWGYKVLLPAYEMTQQEMCMAVLHELVHLRHNDIVSKDMSFVVQILHGLNPLTKKTKEHLVKWAEVLCDITTCEMGRDYFSRKDYYDCIHRLMDYAQNDIKNDAMFCLSESKSLLVFRVNMFKESTKEGQRRLKRVFNVVLIFMLLVTAIVFGITMNTTNAMFEENVVEIEEQLYQELFLKTTMESSLLKQGRISADEVMLQEKHRDMEYTLESNGIAMYPIDVVGKEVLHLFVFTEGRCALGYVKGDGSVFYKEQDNTLVLNLNAEEDAKKVFVKNLTNQPMLVEVSYIQQEE